MGRIVARGEWMYDGIAPTPILIVRLDYDFWFAIAEANGDLEHGEAPELNEDGWAFYVRSRPGWTEGDAFWPDGIGHLSIEDAKRAAEQSVTGALHWK